MEDSGVCGLVDQMFLGPSVLLTNSQNHKQQKEEKQQDKFHVWAATKPYFFTSDRVSRSSFELLKCLVGNSSKNVIQLNVN